MKLPLPPLLFLGCLLAGWGAGRLHALPLGAQVIPGLPWLLALGLVIPAGLGGSALFRFRRHGTTHEPQGMPTALVATGPYRFTRNPMYLALSTLLTWFALLLDSAWVLLLVPVLVLLLDRVVIPFEEARLRGLFGEAYLDYCRRVRRWL
jgi:protein-S-isoprenylcysteine O-methyltransferase Ste14